MTTTTVTREIKEFLLDRGEAIEQDSLLNVIADGDTITRNDVLNGLRTLMQQNHVSYTIDYKIQLDSRGEPHLPDQ